MLIGGIVLGLVLGLIAGGNVVNLATIRLRRLELLAVALLLRVVTDFLLNAGVEPWSRRCGSRSWPGPSGSSSWRCGRTAATRA